MFEKKYFLPTPDKDLIHRMAEVEYYFVFRHLFKKLEGGSNERGNNFLHALSEYSDVNVSAFIFLYGQLTLRWTEPTKKELAITLRYYGLSYSDIYEHFHIHKDTVRKYVQEFLENPKSIFRKAALTSPELREDFSIVLDALVDVFASMESAILLSSGGKKLRTNAGGGTSGI